MIRKILISTLAVFAAMHLLSACCNCPDAYESQPIEWVGASVITGAYTRDSSGIRYEPYDGTDYSGRRLAILIGLDGKLVVLHSSPRPRDWFGMAAYACKCDFIRYRPTSEITTLAISTLYDFDSLHPAGSRITPYFKSSGYLNGAPVLEPLRVQEALDNATTTPRIAAFLDAQPDVPGPQRFAIELQLSNGTVFRDTTALLQF